MQKQNNYPDPGAADTEDMVSSTDCTGALQILPHDDQIEAYREICGLPEQGGLEKLLRTQKPRA